MKSLQFEGKLAPQFMTALERQGYTVTVFENYFDLALSEIKIGQILGYPLNEGYIDLKKLFKIKKAVFSIDEPVFFNFLLSINKNELDLNLTEKFRFLLRHDYLPLTYYQNYALKSFMLTENELGDRYRMEINFDFNEAVDLLVFRIEEKFEEELHKISKIIFS